MESIAIDRRSAVRSSLPIFIAGSVVIHVGVLVPAIGWAPSFLSPAPSPAATVTVFISARAPVPLVKHDAPSLPVPATTAVTESRPVATLTASNADVAEKPVPTAELLPAVDSTPPVPDVSDSTNRAKPEIAARSSDPPQGSAPAVAATGPDVESAYLSELLTEIARHKFYPSSARRRGFQGRVEISLTIRRDGEFEQVSIGRRSGHAVLDKAATRSLRAMGRFKAFPAAMRRSTWTLAIPFRYQLTNDAG